MVNEVEETLRAIDATIAHHKLQIKELNQAKKDIMDKYNIPYDKITVVEQTTAERKAELLELFDKCKPLLIRGYSLRMAVQKAKDIKHVNTKLAWYRDLKEIAIEQGYGDYL